MYFMLNFIHVLYLSLQPNEMPEYYPTSTLVIISEDRRDGPKARLQNGKELRKTTSSPGIEMCAIHVSGLGFVPITVPN